MSQAVELIDKANLVRERIRLVWMAANALDDADDRETMLYGGQQALDTIDDLLDTLRRLPKEAFVPNKVPRRKVGIGRILDESFRPEKP